MTGRGNLFEKRAGSGELRMAGPLRQIAGDDDQIGMCARQIGQQEFRRGLVMAPEMQIRQMGDRFHDNFGSATITRSARGRMR